MGVSYFFILSGFIMVVAYFDHAFIDPKKYYISRIARIFPLYIFAIIFFLPNIILDYSTTKGIELILNLFALQSWIPTKALSINSPGWSISTEVFFYAIFPFFFNKFYKNKSILVVYITIFLFFMASQFIYNFLLQSDFYQGYPSPSHDILHYFPPMHVSEFLIGNIAGIYYTNNFRVNIKNNTLPIFLLSIIIIWIISTKKTLSLHNGLLAFLFVPLIFFISSDNGLIFRIFSKKFMVFLGEISFGIYILQMPIYGITYKILTKLSFLSESEKFYAYFLTLMVISIFCFYKIETPLRKKINELYKN